MFELCFSLHVKGCAPWDVQCVMLQGSPPDRAEELNCCPSREYEIWLRQSTAGKMQRSAELSVFKGKEVRRGCVRLQKQKSLTNLTLISEGEKRRHSYRENWFGNASKSSQCYHQQEAEAERKGLLSKALSRSVHSLCQPGLTAPQAFQALPSAGSRTFKRSGDRCTDEGFGIDNQERGKSDDENVSCTAHFASRNWAEEEEEGCLREGTAHLDEDVIITMLGDLEQVLYTDILGKFMLSSNQETRELAHFCTEQIFDLDSDFMRQNWVCLQ